MNQNLQIAATSPTELEMHRMAHKSCQSAGWESPEEVLSAYGTLKKAHEALVAHCKELETKLEASLGRERAHAADVREMGGMLAAWRNQL